MKFKIDHALLAEAREALSKHENIYWLVGGSGSGKTTICKALSTQLNLPIYDMDAHIYGEYHGRFTEERHPVNKAWASAENGLGWLLDMSWDEFYGFNQAALPEYLDLLSEDIQLKNPDDTLLIDGGIWHPSLLTQVISPRQVICLETEETSVEVWEENAERYTMREMFNNFPETYASWRKFLKFNQKITQTILRESRENNIFVCSREKKESVDEFAERVALKLGIQQD